MTDNILSQGWLAQTKSIMTKFNCINNMYRIDFGNTTSHISMEKETLYYLSKEQVQQILTHLNNISQNVKVDIMK